MTLGALMNIILGIPGMWPSLDALVESIPASCGYHLDGADLVRQAVQRRFQLELVEHDPALRKSYEHANRLSLSEDDLARIAGHVHTAYLVCPGGTLDAARDAMQAADTLLAAGGFAVKVETSGIAHSARNWHTQTERSRDHVGALYIAYVALIASTGLYFSCGMHNLGLSDATVSGDLSTTVAGNLLRDFLLSLIHQQPGLTEVDVNLSDATGAQYTLTHEPCKTWPSDDPFYNPYGIWRLTPR